MPSDHSDNVSFPVPARRAAVGNTHPAMYVRDSGGRQSGGALEQWMSLKFLLWVLGQWWMIVIPVGLVLAAIAAGVVLYSYVPKYQATAWLTIEDAAPFVAFPGSRDSSNYIQTQLELIRNQIVLDEVIKRRDVAPLPELANAEDPVAHLRTRFSIGRSARSDLYSFNYTSPSPEAAAVLVNAIVAEYLKFQSTDEYERTQQVIDILDVERQRREAVVNDLRENIIEMAKEITGRDPFGGIVSDYDRALSPVGSIFQMLTESEVDREVMDAELESLRLAPPPTDNMASSGLLDLEVDNHEVILTRRSALAELEAQMEQIKDAAIEFEKDPEWETKPAYLALKAKLAIGQQNLEEEKVKVRAEIIAHTNELRKAERQLQIESLDNQIKHLEARNALLKERFDKEVAGLQLGGGKSVQMEFRRAELARAEKVFELIASRKLALQTELRAPVRVELQRQAQIPRFPLEPVPYKRLFMACSMALMAPLGLAFLREITVRRISDTEQLAQYSGIRVLGEIAALPVRQVAVSPHQLSKRLRRDTHVYAESINSLRTNLALAEGLSQQVLAVTGASPGEGKTSVAVSLAMSIASATEKPTLIIDGDMRSPFAAAMLKAKSHPGLFEVLTNACTLEEAIQPVGDNGLCIIPGGRATKSTHRVLGMEEISQLLEKLRTRFSTIVIDTPPILGASEALVLAKAADGVLFCSLCGVSKAAQVRLAVDRLMHARANIVGAVLSGTSIRRYQFVYGYYANENGEDE